MKIIPVIDLKAGLVVRAVAGERSSYAPIVSRFAADARPLTISESLVRNFGFQDVYVADLDAIAGHVPDWLSYQAISAVGLNLLLDAGTADIGKILRVVEWDSRCRTRVDDSRKPAASAVPLTGVACVDDSRKPAASAVPLTGVACVDDSRGPAASAVPLTDVACVDDSRGPAASATALTSMACVDDSRKPAASAVPLTGVACVDDSRKPATSAVPLTDVACIDDSRGPAASAVPLTDVACVDDSREPAASAVPLTDVACVDHRRGPAASATPLTTRGHVARIVIASENLGRINSIPDLLTACSPLRPTFSLDLRNGELLGMGGGNLSHQPVELLDRVVQLGVRSVIVLDLAAVGLNQGPRTLDICREIRTRYPEIELISGGGVRHRSDLLAFEDVGCDGVLVASALHDGKLTETCLPECGSIR